jgi:seryl-tRNA(Sec) selenium transferase
VDEVFKALADPTRRSLLDELFREDGQTLTALEERLRAAAPPVVARIQDDRVVIDLRTVSSEEMPALTRVLSSVGR